VTTSLGERVPTGELAGDDDAILEAYLDWVAELGIELYPAQEEAVLEVIAGRHLILDTPTGSGKSMVAIAALFRALCRGEVGVYTSPIKALVSEKFFDMCEIFGPHNVAMATGDASINPGAPIRCCTAEILASVALREGRRAEARAVVMDEFHYFADRERGIAWQIPLLRMPSARFVLMSATLGDTAAFEREIPTRTGSELSLVRSVERPVPLTHEYSETPLHEAILELAEGGRAPVYVVGFTQRAASELAQDLTSLKLVDREHRARITDTIGSFRFDSTYGRDLQRFLKAGVGVHHAGLLPKYRRLVERLAQAGLLPVICGTDTLGVGINIPLRTVLFTRLCKYDGEKDRLLSVRDFKQIAGRAGRKGHDDRGWVVCQAPPHVIENKRLEIKAAAKGRKKFTRKKPPERGYVHWDADAFERLQTKPPEALDSSFTMSPKLILDLLSSADGEARRGGGYGEVVDLIADSYERDGRKRRLRREGAVMFRTLREAGIAQLHPRPTGTLGRDVALAEGLDQNFSIFHTLGVFLLESVSRLDPEADDYALRLLTRVEAIVEDPRVVLYAQDKHARGEAVARMKAEGMEYEERMAELETVGRPRPEADALFSEFNAFRAKHPWVSEDTVRPKSVAREMFERFLSFDAYIKELGIKRSEGVLLRYLDGVHRTLRATIPDVDKTEPVLELIAWLAAIRERVDSSLTREWEALIEAPMIEGLEVRVEGPPVEDLLRDRRALAVRVRIEVHGLVRALAHRDFTEVAASLRPGADEQESDEARFDAAGIESAMRPLVDRDGQIRFDHEARLRDKTDLRELGGGHFVVRQTLLDTLDDGDWFLEGEIDLSDDPSPAGPLIHLRHLGR
jgi:superfamily II DNA/RNA helicase